VIYVVGDVHLSGGERETHAPAFLRFLADLQRKPPARLVILGDLFDYWLETPDAERRYAHALAALKALRAAGWRLDLVQGNRELAGGRRLALATGCALHPRRLDIDLAGRRLRVVHGDRLVHDPGYRLFAAWISSFWHRWWQRLHPAWMQDLVAAALRRRSEAGRRATYRQRIFIDRRRVQAAARGADTILAGHIHQSWRRTVGGVDLILVGDWPGGIGHWVEGFADGTLIRLRARFPGSVDEEAATGQGSSLSPP
jgi:UDP-2,3-diacylglucosamine hydrolase